MFKHSWFAALFLGIVFTCLTACNSTKESAKHSEQSAIKTTANDTVSIKSDKVEYEIIIIEPGYNSWLYGTTKPEGYYDQKLLETRNRLFVTEWNLRVIQPQQYESKLYELRIDYNPQIDYGYELNYKLYNYFIFFQLKYKQQLTATIPRI